MRGFRCDREHAEHIAAQAESGDYYGLAVFASDVLRRYCRTRSVGPRPSESVEGKEAEAGCSQARIADAGRHSPLALAAGRSQDGVLQQRLSDRMVAYSWIDGLEGPDIPMLGIGVIDEYQNVGLGRALLRLMIRSAGHLGVRRLRLGVFEHNSRAIRVYESVGFRMDSTTPPRVFNGHTEMYMLADTGNGPEASLPNGPP